MRLHHTFAIDLCHSSTFRFPTKASQGTCDLEQQSAKTDTTKEAHVEDGGDPKSHVHLTAYHTTLGAEHSPCPNHPTSIACHKSHLESPAPPLPPLVAMVLFLLALLPSGPELGAQLPSSPVAGIINWQHQHFIQLAQHTKTCKSSYHWTAAFIQHLWDTAWDLLTHRNVESICPLGLACPTYRMGKIFLTLSPGTAAYQPATGPCIHHHPKTTQVGPQHVTPILRNK